MTEDSVYEISIEEIPTPDDSIYEGTIEEIAVEDLPDLEAAIEMQSEDGQGGVETLGLRAARSAIGHQAVLIARGQAGVAESGAANCGVPHKRYTRYFGSNLPCLPWCAFFVSWSFAQAGRRPPWRNPGYVGSFHEWARANGRLVSRPAHGDIFGLKDMSHTGLVAGANPGKGQIFTIEGNYSNRVGSRLMSTGGLWFARL